MKSSAIDILELLMKGIHPITGEIFEDDHVCNEPSFTLYRNTRQEYQIQSVPIP